MIQITIVLILLIIVILVIISMNEYDNNLYFFLNKDDDKSFKKLKKILKKSKYKIILVNYGKDIDLLKLNNLLNNIKHGKPIHKIINIEKMEDVQNIYYNRKCVNHPDTDFYQIKNKVGVFGYPFDFENNSSELLNSDSDNTENTTYSSKSDINILKNYVDTPTCGRRRSGCK